MAVLGKIAAPPKNLVLRARENAAWSFAAWAKGGFVRSEDLHAECSESPVPAQTYDTHLCTQGLVFGIAWAIAISLSI